MLDRNVTGMGTGTGTTAQLATLLGTQVAIGAATHLAFGFFEKCLGSHYSQTDKNKLEELKAVYTEVLRKEAAPPFWELDEKDRPTFHLSQRKWSEYERQLSAENHRNGKFFYQRTLIAQYAATYLTARSKRWFGKGTSGDLLEQFISEWINFALKELPNLNFDDESIEKIQLRLNYLDHIQTHENLFKYGLIKRKRDKFDTMESIRQQLESCIAYATRGSLLECAREKFDVCRTQLGTLLHASVSSVYYARETAINNEPFNIQALIDPHTFLSDAAKSLYTQIKGSHTGAMLAEVITVANLASFGGLNSKETQHKPLVYFAENHQSQAFNLACKKADLPPWISQSDQAYYISETQKILESTLRIVQLKKLVEEAYDLTGKVGDVWAYGDRQGKLSLDGLLFSLEKELDLFKERYDALYKTQNNWRRVYNHQHRINPGKDINLNFNMVTKQRDKINEYYNSLKSAITDIRAKMKDFSEEDLKQIDTRKKVFYQTVAHFIKEHYPSDYATYKDLEKTELLLEKKAFEELSPQLELKLCVEELSLAEYKAWKEVYLSQHQAAYCQLQYLIHDFTVKLNKDELLAAQGLLEHALLEKLQEIKIQAESERPFWRLNRHEFRIGWPFYQQKKRCLQLLSHECDLIYQDLGSLVPNELEGEREKVSVLPVILEPQAESMQPSKKNEVNYQNNPSLTFAPSREIQPKPSKKEGLKPSSQTNPFCN